MPGMRMAMCPVPLISRCLDFELNNLKWNGTKTLLFTFRYSILKVVGLPVGLFFKNFLFLRL